MTGVMTAAGLSGSVTSSSATTALFSTREVKKMLLMSTSGPHTRYEYWKSLQSQNRTTASVPAVNT